MIFQWFFKVYSPVLIIHIFSTRGFLCTFFNGFRGSSRYFVLYFMSHGGFLGFLRFSEKTENDFYWSKFQPWYYQNWNTVQF